MDCHDRHDDILPGKTNTHKNCKTQGKSSQQLLNEDFFSREFCQLTNQA